MQTTPSFLPIPTNGHSGPQGSGGSFPRQAGWGDPMGSLNGMSGIMRSNDTPPGGYSPSSNPHSGFHPGSFGAPLSFSALALGATAPGSSPYASSMAMSISPPRWTGGSLSGGFSSGSFVGSVGALGTSFGRQAEGRERELEAKYVKDFTCCGRQLSGLHELLEHYEEEHANLAPDVRMAAISAVQSGPQKRPAFTASMSMNHGDVPTTPGMMDMDMEMDDPIPTPAALLQQASAATVGVNLVPSASPWSAAFRPPSLQPPACVPPSVLSYAPPAPTPPQQPSPREQPSTPGSSHGQQKQLSAEHIQAKILKKAQKKAEREAKEEGDDDHPGEKRFRCPIEGCGKVYKQANGLKYHLTRSINSGHGNVAAMGGLMSLLGEEDKA